MSEEKVNVHRDLAEREAEIRWQEARDRLRYAVEYAQGGLKGLFLANGGAIISLLTFSGNVKKYIDLHSLKVSFVLYSCGLVAIIAGYIAAYLSQTYIMQQEFNLSRQAMSDARGLGEVYDHACWEKKGDIAVTSGLVLALFSVIFFIWGSIKAIDAIT